MRVVANLSKCPQAITPVLRAAVGAALACTFATGPAAAQYSPTQEFQTGFSLLRFEPAKAGDRFFGVPDAAVPGNHSSRFRAQLLGDFATAPILSRTDNLSGQTVDVISKQFLTHLGVGYFPIDALLFSADLPLVLSQSGNSPTTPSGAALGDTRLGARFGLIGSENAKFSLAPALDVWLPTGSQDKLTGDGKLRAQPMVSFGGREGSFVWSAELGYQLRRHIDSGSVEIGNSYAFGAAAGLLLFDDALQVGPELRGAALASPSQGSAFDSRNRALEALFGAKVRAGDFAFGAAAGPGLAHTPGTAPRFLLSIAFAPHARYVHEGTPPPPKPDPATPTPTPTPTPDGDEDGIADADDACPAEPGKASDDKTKNGCPPPPPAVTPAALPATPAPGEEDTDQDGIPDNEDACKRVKGIASDTPQLNGCPAPVAKAIVTPPAPPPPPADSDGDGIPDRLDACPEQVGVHSRVAKKNGCPVQPASTPNGAPSELTFSGFRSFDDGSSLVFVELSGPVTVDVKKLRGAVLYTLENTKVPVRNNRNPLLTVDFSSSVRRATIAQKKKAVEITILLKADVQPEHRLVQRGGATVLEIQLPKAPPTPPPGAPARPNTPKAP